MHADRRDLLVDDLMLDPLKYKTHAHCRESTGLLPAQQSPWILREFFNLRDFHLNRIYHDFFLIFSPDHVFTQRSVYDIREGKKFFLGVALDTTVMKGLEILDTRDSHVLIDQGIVEAISVLFFLNQSYSQLENFFIDMTDRYKIIRFDSTRPDAPLTEMQYYSFLTDADQSNKVVPQFLTKLAGFVSKDSQKCPPFFKKRELTLLNIVIAPDVDQLFDFSGCMDLKAYLSFRKKQLREILLTSNRFSEIIFQLTPVEFQNNLGDFFYCLKKYDEKNFSRHRDVVIENYVRFFWELLKIKFELISSELQREVSSVVFNEKDADAQRIYNMLMIKAAFNQFYFLLNETGFFSEFIVNRFPTCLSLLRVFNTIVLNFEENDSHRKQITLLKSTMENVSNSHELVRSFISTLYQPAIDFADMSNDINLDEIVQYSQDWLGRTDLIGLETVFLNKNSLLLMFDRALWCENKTRRASQAPYSTSFLQPAMKLREQVASAKTVDEIKAFIYKLIRLSDDSFLTFFFRQLILHCHFEIKFGMFAQHVIALKDFDEKIVHKTIGSLLLTRITHCQVKEFWNKVLFMYEAVAQEAGWCRIEIHPISNQHFSASHSSFFGVEKVTRVVVSSAENLLSTATTAVESDSTRAMVDSLKSIAGSTSHTVAAAAASAKAAVSSASELIGAWWKKS